MAKSVGMKVNLVRQQKQASFLCHADRVREGRVKEPDKQDDRSIMGRQVTNGAIIKLINE